MKVMKNRNLSQLALENLLKQEGFLLPIDLQALEVKYQLSASQDEVLRTIDKYKDDFKVQLLILYYFISKEPNN